MKCPKCENDIPEDSKFCQYCGKILPAEEPNSNTTNTKKEQLSIESSQQAGKNDKATPKEVNVSVTYAPEAQNIKGYKLPLTESDYSGASGKKKYCKKCGGLIDSKTKKCNSCGKQYFRLSGRVFIVTALVIVILSLIGLNIYQAVTVSELEKKDKRKTSVIADLYAENSSLESENNFYENHVAIVPDNSSRLYHKYGCNDIGDSSFWIYNTEAAESRGCSPCPKCH